MVNTTGGLTLFTQENPGVIRLEDLYNPTVTPPTGTIIPALDTLVIDAVNNNTIYVVDAVDPITHASTLRPARMAVSNTDPTQSLTSVISYSNDVFRLYYDPRTSPVRIRPDSRILIFGTDNVSYQLVLNPGPSQTVISRHYDSSGNYTGALVPLVELIGPDQLPRPGASYCAPCYVQTTLVDNQEIYIEVFNSEGAQTALVSTFAKASIIMNELITPDPVITAVAITSTQSRSNNEIFIYQNQSVNSLGLQVVLTYSDGYQRTAPIDQNQCFLYGLEDFIPSYPGLRQTIIAKYFLDTNEVVSSSLAQGPSNYVSAEASLVVITNGLQAGVKISTIPVWNGTFNRYDLNYFLYTTTRDRVVNVSSMVTISSNTIYNGSLFGIQQPVVLQLDMSQAEPTIYSTPTQYLQTVYLTLQPLAATDRYAIADGTPSQLSYGITTTALPRPIIHYDASRQQYYVPSSFTSVNNFLQAFYFNANPPYDTSNETIAPTPTHFYLRDPSSGVMLTAAPLPVAQYNTAQSIIGAGLANRYAGIGSNVIVEFVYIVSSSSTLILYGVPVDVIAGTYNG